MQQAQCVVLEGGTYAQVFDNEGDRVCNSDRVSGGDKVRAQVRLFQWSTVILALYGC
jgi:hypothetical protein